MDLRKPRGVTVGRWGILLLMLVVLDAASGQEKTLADWPGWRGPQRTGRATESGWIPSWSAEPKIAWQAWH